MGYGGPPNTTISKLIPDDTPEGINLPGANSLQNFAFDKDGKHTYVLTFSERDNTSKILLYNSIIKDGDQATAEYKMNDWNLGLGALSCGGYIAQ